MYLEITESATFTHYDLCRNVLAELCSRTGALLVVDDFGAGYSNLERLARLEPAVVKLDIALIHDIHEHRRRQIVTRHMVSLCEELGARVVAEGVEKLERTQVHTRPRRRSGARATCSRVRQPRRRPTRGRCAGPVSRGLASRRILALRPQLGSRGVAAFATGGCFQDEHGPPGRAGQKRLGSCDGSHCGR